MKVAVLMDNIGKYTGGRIYMWDLAYALVRLGRDVTVYTNQRAGFIMNDRRGRKKPKVKVGDHNPKADLYVGMPISPNEKAVDLATRHGGKALCCIFDSYPALKRAGIQWKELPEKWPKLNRGNTWILSLAKANEADICEWCGVEPERVKVLHPCVNDGALDLDAKFKKRNEVVFLSRLVKHKNLAHLVDITEPLGVSITVITSDRADRGGERLSWRVRVSDKIKFQLLRSCRCVCVPSTHEGFGMWAAEAWAAGVPVVCYNLPTIREASNGGTYFAKAGDKWNLQQQLIRCLDEAKSVKPDKRFYFGQMVKGLEGIIEEIMT